MDFEGTDFVVDDCCFCSFAVVDYFGYPNFDYCVVETGYFDNHGGYSVHKTGDGSDLFVAVELVCCSSFARKMMLPYEGVKKKTIFL